jgi:hypothetical protein
MAREPSRSSSAPPPGNRPLYGTPAPPPKTGPTTAPGSRLGVLSIVLVVALLALACVLVLGFLGGSEDAPLSPIAVAAEKTAALSGARFEGTGGASAQGLAFTMSFSGAYNADDDRTIMRMESEVPQAPQAAAMVSPLQMVGDGSVLYMTAPAFSGSLPGGKSWLKMDTAELGADMSADALGTNGIDARSTLDQLAGAGGDIRRVGRERIRGARTVHYVTTLDAKSQAEQLRESGYDQIAEMIERQGGGSTAEVWIDRKGFVRRTATSMPFELVGGPGSTMSMTMDFFDFDAAPEITVPADGEAFDATELGREALEEIAGTS